MTDRSKLSALLEADVRDAAVARGMILKVRFVLASRKKKRFIQHWMFNESTSGERVVDYWPSNGTYYCQRTGEKGKAADPWEALEIASKLGAEIVDDEQPAA